MFGLSLGHLLILLVVVLLFGARRLPELGAAMGKGMRAFKKGLEGLDEDTPPRLAEGPRQGSSASSSGTSAKVDNAASAPENHV